MALPKLNLKGKTFGVKNTIAYPVAGLGLLAGGAYLLWSAYGGSFNWSLPNLFGQPTVKENKAVRVSFNVYPNVVKPFRKIRVQGQFEDANGIVSNVPVAYYAIFESVASGSYATEGRLLVSSGVLGYNVGAFRQDLITDNYRTGPYTIYLSNKAITSDPLRGKQAELQILGRRPISLA